jgi:hypothetical protein
VCEAPKEPHAGTEHLLDLGYVRGVSVREGPFLLAVEAGFELVLNLMDFEVGLFGFQEGEAGSNVLDAEVTSYTGLITGWKDTHPRGIKGYTVNYESWAASVGTPFDFLSVDVEYARNADHTMSSFLFGASMGVSLWPAPISGGYSSGKAQLLWFDEYHQPNERPTIGDAILFMGFIALLPINPIEKILIAPAIEQNAAIHAISR